MKKCFDNFWYAVIGGICIGMGGTAFLCVDDKVVGSMLFTLGLFTICSMGFNLFTGKVAYTLENKPSFIFTDLLFIWLGNLVGVATVAISLSFTRIGAGMKEKAVTMCTTKLNDNLLSMFMLAIFCNLLIFIAVDGFKKNPHEIGKYVGLFLGVVGFIFSGFEHSIADMFYFSVAQMWSLNALLYIFIVTLGNAVGGMLIPVFRMVHDKVKNSK